MKIQYLIDASEAEASGGCGVDRTRQCQTLRELLVAAYELFTPEQREIFWRLQPVKTCLEEGGYLPKGE